ncbi:MAG: FtsK/SpoIIIE domain-containing protein [Acidimicrobiales bacterium]
MHITFRGEREERDLVVADGADATVADLLAMVVPSTAASSSGARGAVIDGAFVPGGRPLDRAGMREGSTIEVAAAAGQQGPREPPAGLSFDVVGGLDAGRRVPLRPGEHVVGRTATLCLAHPTISRRHALVTVTAAGAVTVADLGSRNGTWLGERAIGRRAMPLELDAVVSVGALRASVRRSRFDDRGGGTAVAPAGAVAFNRPPRAAPPPAAAPVSVPEPPKVAPPRAQLSVAAFVLPLLMAAVLVKVVGNPTFALFALLSPMLMVGSTIEQRRRGARTHKRDAATYRAQLRTLGDELAAAATVERARRVASLPDLAEVTRRVALPSVRLWERRGTDADALCLRLGTGDIGWLPPLEEPRRPRLPALDSVIAAHSCLADAPVELELRAGAVVGLVGDRTAARAVARSLVVQVAAHHGPADVAIAVLCAPEAVGAWDWTKWLPHGHVDGAPMLAGDPDSAEAVAGALLANPAGNTTLVVVDDESLLEGRRSPVRALLQGRGGPVSGIVVAGTVDRLPAACSAIVALRGADGVAELRCPQLGDASTPVLVSGCGLDVARAAARHLARFEDPEVDGVGAGLPDRVGLRALLPGGPSLDAVVKRTWAANRAASAARAPIGVGSDGPVDVDLDRDGPHVLIAGTTGSGKSELLRTLVAGLAALSSPEQLTFLLIDFKGGAAFDACARLPHTVGLVTDLDEHLAQRALRCLDAELRHRERLLREHGAADLATYRLVSGAPCLPRLVVVVDEFATLKAEVPGFIDALVGVAQRGRSLGVHLVLATQRPAGAVSDDIRANTALRIALRVQSATDSNDVLGDAAAAQIPRGRPGRALVRFGPGELVSVQAALVTGHLVGGDASLTVTPFTFAGSETAAPAALGGPSDLAALVDACGAAAADAGLAPPRRPWPDPLPTEIDLEALTPGDGAVVAFAVADDPDQQRQRTYGWRPRAGNLLVWGIGGSGASTALGSIAIALAQRHPPDAVHLYVVVGGGGELGALAGLPHCGAVITAGEREREVRLLRWLRSELAERQSLPGDACAARPAIIVLIDGYAAFASERTDAAGMAVLDDLGRVFAAGTSVGIHVAITADRVGSVPLALTALTHQRLLLRLADTHDYSLVGVAPRALPSFVPGRGIDAESGCVVQVARPAGRLAAVVARVGAQCSAPGPSSRRPVAIGVLPTAVPRALVVGHARVGERPWFLPVGIGERSLRAAGFELYEGEHAIVAGPARSGRSSALLALAAGFSVAAPAGTVIAVAGPRSALARAGVSTHRPNDVSGAVSAARLAVGPTLLLIDDAELVDDPEGALGALLAEQSGALAVVAAGRADSLRAAYGHWSRDVRRAKTGLVLQPDTDLDGELVGLTLPRRSPVALSFGRGWLRAAGDLQVVQVAS